MRPRGSTAQYAVNKVSPNFDWDLDTAFDDMFEIYDAGDDLAEEIRRRKNRRSPRSAPRTSGRSHATARPQRPPPKRPMRNKTRRRPRRRPRPRPRSIRGFPRAYRRPIFSNQPAAPCICPAQGTEMIRWVQSTLNQRYGLRLPVNGVANTPTRRAIRKFQKEKGLPVDGIAGPDTESALLHSRSADTDRLAQPKQSEITYYGQGHRYAPLRPGGRDDVLWVQRALNRIMRLRLTLDGILGPATRSAIRSFQGRYGLAVDGVVGPRTKAKLIRLGAGAPSPVRKTPDALPRTKKPSHPPPSPDTVLVTLGTNARVSDNAVSILKDILRDAGLTRAMITSGRRTSTDQARIMYDLITRNGVSYAKNLYGRYGDQVIDVYSTQKGSGKSQTVIKQAMEAKIKTLGCHRVSHHCSDEFDVFDVGPRSIANSNAFSDALKRALERGIIDNYITPPDDPAFHIEIKLKPAWDGV